MKLANRPKNNPIGAAVTRLSPTPVQEMWLTPGVNPAENDESQNTAVAGHSAVPNTKDPQRIFKDHVGAVEKYVTDPAAGEHSKKGCVKDEIGDFAFAERAIAFPGEPLDQIKSSDETCQVGQSIPANAKLFIKSNDKRVQVMNPEGYFHEGAL